MRQLTKFAISVRDEDFVIRIEDDAGQQLEFATAPEQVDAIIDALDELLSEDDDAFEVQDEGESYQKPLG
jgi:hypothetical protein